MSQLVLEIIRFVLNLIERAISGNEDALQRLCEFVPEEMRAELIDRIQSNLDAVKPDSRTTVRP